MQQHLLREVEGDAVGGAPAIGLADDDQVAAASVLDDRVDRLLDDDLGA